MSSDKNSAYSPLKVFHHREALDALATGSYTPPIHLQLIISDLCNQDCNFCAYRMSGYSSNELFGRPDSSGRTNPNRMIEYGKCVEILEDAKKLGTKAVQFTGGGEPTVHPNHVMIFEECLNRDMDLALVTNGVRLQGPLLRTITKASWVRVSIDAGTKETYSLIRRVDRNIFNRVWENIDELVKIKGNLIIGIGFVVTKENWHEVLQCTQRAQDSGVDNIRISAIFQPEGFHYFNGWLEQAAHLCKAAEELATKDFRVFNNFGSRVADLLEESPDYEFCGIQNLQTYIGADLNLYRCCVTSYNSRGLIGSLKNQTFYDLWKAKDLNKDFDARGCPACMYNDKNKTILYAINSNAMHKNFI